MSLWGHICPYGDIYVPTQSICLLGKYVALDMDIYVSGRSHSHLLASATGIAIYQVNSVNVTSYLRNTRARLAQSVEHQTFNLRVMGSSPISGERRFKCQAPSAMTNRMPKKTSLTRWLCLMCIPYPVRGSSDALSAQGLATFIMCFIPAPDQQRHTKTGLVRDLNPGPLAPKARIIPLDQRASNDGI